MTFTTIITDENNPPMEVEVEFEYHHGMPGLREHGTGLRLSPDDDPEIEILSVTRLDNKEEVELDKADEKRITEKCWEKLQEGPQD